MSNQYQDSSLLIKVISVIKKIRKEKNITLEVFYFDTGIHLARIEQGKTNLTISTLSKICLYFNIQLSDFFKLVEEEDSQEIKAK
jgi:transcriptional regulator with XRE-family HTH domain